MKKLFIIVILIILAGGIYWFFRARQVSAPSGENVSTSTNQSAASVNFNTSDNLDPAIQTLDTLSQGGVQ